MEIFGYIGDLITFIIRHVVSFIEFLISLPSFILKLIEFIPEPIKSISGQFIIYIILIIVMMASAKIISSVKGG